MKKEKKTTVSRKFLVLCLALVLVLGCAIGGTLAWLIDTTDPVENTFTAAGIDIDLTETFNTDTDDDGEPDAWQAHMIPGKTYTKDPEVSVNGDATDVDIYLYVKFEEEGDPATYLTYTSTLTAENGWQLVAGETNVWWREVKTGDTVKSWKLLANDEITVKDSVTKENMTAASAAELIYTAYAIQTEGFTDAADAWAEIGG